MTETQSGQWPNYTYIVPEIYTRAKVRLIGLGIYTPSGVITNEFFASISTRLGDPRSADDLERVTGLSTRHVRASTLLSAHPLPITMPSPPLQVRYSCASG